MTESGGRPLAVEQLLVTPEMAGEWLTRNPHNRNESPKRIRRYARDMSAGRWMLTHQPIAFDEQDDLLDGQNRLQALLRSNTSQEFLVVRGAPRESFYVVDTGKPRNFADALTIRGESNARLLAASTNILWRITEGRENGNPASDNPDTPRALEFFEPNAEGLRAAMKPAHHVYYYLHGPHSAYGGLYHLFATIHQEDADLYYERLAVGTHMEAGDPILALRNNILAVTRSADTKFSVDRIYTAALMIKAWNAYRQNRSVRQLAWKRGGANPEAFPVAE